LQLIFLLVTVRIVTSSSAVAILPFSASDGLRRIAFKNIYPSPHAWAIGSPTARAGGERSRKLRFTVVLALEMR
jgi:hypothetical protein